MTIPEWLKRSSTAGVAAAVATSALWFFFFERTTGLKDEQIKLWRDRAAVGAVAEGIPHRVDNLEAKVSFLQKMLQVDPVDGRWRIGGISGPSDLTQMIADGEAKANARDFDGALELARRAEEILPDFAGAAFIRFLVDQGKGYEAAAATDALKAINLAPADKRLLSLYVYLMNYHIKRNEKPEAEVLGRRALRLAPDDKALSESFRSVFGFLPPSP